MKYGIVFCLFLSYMHADMYNRTIRVAAAQTKEYFPLLKNKRLALLTNHTACIDNEHLVDVLIKEGFTIQKIFVPEHGFRGQDDAGAHQQNGIDAKTGISLISLYGKKKKPDEKDLSDVDILIYDIQDVGVRFYTYISSLQYLMEAAAEQKKPLIILDRPNPNGFYIDGPIAENALRSFVGMQSIPIVYGMTVGEYALMLNGEKWLNIPNRCNLTVIPCKNYTHKDYYELPIVPSPNLKTMQAVYIYPSLCLFEGTPISIGRGTHKPFELFGHPTFTSLSYAFTPRAMPGAKNPPFVNQVCYGIDLSDTPEKIIKKLNGKLNLHWLKQSYALYPYKSTFFNSFFDKLAGTTQLAKQIKEGLDESAIRKTWQSGLNAFKKIRKKYLLYPD